MSTWDPFRAMSRFALAGVPPHVFALLRITWGLLGLLGLVGVSEVSAYWDLSGLVAPADARAHRLAARLGVAELAGLSLFAGSIAAYVAMTLGVASRLSVVAAFLVSIVQTAWNPLPLSGAYQVHRVLLFCLIWTDCGAVWSLDAWMRGARDDDRQPIWPLRLFRFQIAVIYGVTGLYKLQDVHWRDGSALHYVMSNVQFRRAPIDPPPWSAEILTFLTYLTLFWELLFPVLILHRVTRRVTLALGIMMHAGMWMTMELGPFAPVMMASYLAFLDPADAQQLPGRLRESGRRLRRLLPFPASTGG